MKNDPENIESKKIKKEKNIFAGRVLISAAIHIIVFAILILLLEIFPGKNLPQGKYVEITMVRGAKIETPQNEPKEEIKREIPEKEILDDDEIQEPEKEIKKDESSTTENESTILTSGFDSTSLKQIYSESTLNVRLKYPSGWVYVDQQNKNKLDGVTFWSANSEIQPPPYVHLEVVEKYMFNPDQYEHQYKFRNFTGYYNDPVELEGQVSQSIYLLTETDEDYIIKVIVIGKENFKKFSPVFFSMVNSFKFGRSLF